MRIPDEKLTEFFQEKKCRENSCEKWKKNFLGKNPVKYVENYMVDTVTVFQREILYCSTSMDFQSVYSDFRKFTAYHITSHITIIPIVSFEINERAMNPVLAKINKLSKNKR